MTPHGLVRLIFLLMYVGAGYTVVLHTQYEELVIQRGLYLCTDAAIGTFLQ